MSRRRIGFVRTACALALVALSAAGAAAADGRRLYLDHCAACHGAGGRGDGPNAALFSIRPRDLRGGFLATYSDADLVKRILDGRSLALGPDLSAMRRRAADVEALVAYLQRLPGIDWRLVDEGRFLYDDRCAACHGFYGAAVAPPPPGVRAPRALADAAFQASVSDETLVEIVRHGREGMPALTPRLSEADAVAIAGFVRLFSPGFETYDQYCAVCHGDHGIPDASLGAAAPAPALSFDRAYFARHDPEALRGQVWHMLDRHQPSMPHFRGVLTAAEARAIVDYLKSAQGFRLRHRYAG
ncbi:MAG: c-type cytochrome [Candidatus Binatia bacterium]